ncbi:MAG: NAD(P)H-hydrate epimerase [Planctomycetes bacterium]|nr:NAD(P)H-hydrate epimerase [Planctomycetota bacterium]
MNAVPALTGAQLREIDRLAIQELAIPSLVLMENAGRNAAQEIAGLAARVGAAGIVILCGPGNNGGDGFVIARHLANRGMAVRPILVGDPRKMSPDCTANHRIIENMGLRTCVHARADQIPQLAASIRADDLVVDALLGTGFSGSVRAPLDLLIAAVNDTETAAVVAIDVPSGLDCDTGLVANVAMRADLTLTFVARKVGFDAENAGSNVGEIKVLDIGAPPELVARVLAGNA